MPHSGCRPAKVNQSPLLTLPHFRFRQNEIRAPHLTVMAGNAILEAQGNVQLALRPEHVQMRAAGAAQGGVSGRVLSVAYLGDRSHYLIGVEGLAAPFKVLRSNVVGIGFAPVLGEPVALAWEPNSALILTE